MVKINRKFGQDNETEESDFQMNDTKESISPHTRNNNLTGLTAALSGIPSETVESMFQNVQSTEKNMIRKI